jgi:hypothetical protein
MKKILLFFLLSFAAHAQIFRAVNPVDPLTIAENSGKFGTLVTKKYINGTQKFYYLTSDNEGNINPFAFRQGNIFNDLASVQLPANFSTYNFFDCGLFDGLTVGIWTVANKPTKIRRFNDAWWVVQEVDPVSSRDVFQPRGINFLTTTNQNISYEKILDSRCSSQLSNQVTGTGGLELTPNFSAPDGYELAGEAYQKINQVVVTDCATCTPFDNSLPTAASTFKGRVRFVNDSENPNIICWAYNSAAPNTPVDLDLYIGNFKVMTVKAGYIANDVVEAFPNDNLTNNGLYNFRFDLEHLYWWQNGNGQPVKVTFAGTKTELEFDNNNPIPEDGSSRLPPKTNITKNSGGTGNCFAYRDNVILPSYAANYITGVNIASQGLSVTPYNTSYDVIETATYKIALANLMGATPDWIGKKSETRSRSLQRDSGMQFGIYDPYIGEPSEIQTIFRGVDGQSGRGYTTTEPTRAWNGLPQGVYEFELSGRPGGFNFGGVPFFKEWNNTTKLLTTQANLYQYAFALNNDKVFADATNEQKIRAVADNAFEITYKINLNLTYLNGLQFAQINPFGFFNTEYRYAKYYSGTTPFNNGDLTTIDMDGLPNQSDPVLSEITSVIATEKWVALFNAAGTEGIGIVWNREDSYRASVQQEDQLGAGGNVIYYFPNRDRPTVYPTESIEDKYYIVMGSISEIRDFAYKLNGFPCYN